MDLRLTALSNLETYPNYTITGTMDTDTGQVAMTAEPSNPEAATYVISGSIDMATGNIAITAKSNKVGYTSYTITGSLDPQTGQFYYVRAKPGSFHRPKYYLTSSINWATGHVELTAESQRSIHPNYTITSQTKTKAVSDQ